MKIAIKGNPKEIAELMNALLNGAETGAKKPYFPPLLTELVKSNAIVKNAKVRPIERTFSGLKPNFQDALDKFCGDAGKENAPQAETAERSDDVGIAKKSIDNLRRMISEKTAEFFEEYVNAVSSSTDDHATFNHCFYLRQSAHKMWEMLSKSVVANIWNFDTLFF